MATTDFEIQAQAHDGHMQYFGNGSTIILTSVSALPPSGIPRHDNWEGTISADLAYSYRGLLRFETGEIYSTITAAELEIVNYSTTGSPVFDIYAVNQAAPPEWLTTGQFWGPPASNPDVTSPTGTQYPYVQVASSVSPVGVGTQTYTLDASVLETISQLPGFAGTFSLILVDTTEWDSFVRSPFVGRATNTAETLYRSFLDLPNSVGPSPILRLTYTQGGKPTTAGDFINIAYLICGHDPPVPDAATIDDLANGVHDPLQEGVEGVVDAYWSWFSDFIAQWMPDAHRVYLSLSPADESAAQLDWQHAFQIPTTHDGANVDDLIVLEVENQMSRFDDVLWAQVGDKLYTNIGDGTGLNVLAVVTGEMNLFEGVNTPDEAFLCYLWPRYIAAQIAHRLIEDQAAVELIERRYEKLLYAARGRAHREPRFQERIRSLYDR